MSFKALRATATLRKAGEYQLGEFIDGAKVTGRRAAATRSGNYDTLVWVPLAAFVWRHRSTLLGFGKMRGRLGLSVLVEVQALRQRLESDANPDYDRHLELDDCNIGTRIRTALPRFRPTWVEDYVQEFEQPFNQPQIKQQVGPLSWSALADFVWQNRATLLTYGRFLKNETQRAIAPDVTALRSRLATDRNHSFDEHLKLLDGVLRSALWRKINAVPGRADKYRRETSVHSKKIQPLPKKTSLPTAKLATPNSTTLPKKKTPLPTAQLTAPKLANPNSTTLSKKTSLATTKLATPNPTSQTKTSQGSESASKAKSISTRPVQIIVLEDSDEENGEEGDDKTGGNVWNREGHGNEVTSEQEDGKGGMDSNSDQIEVPTKRERSHETEDDRGKRQRRSSRIETLNHVDRSRTIDLYLTRIVDMSRYSGSWSEFEAAEEASKSAIITSFLVEMEARGIEIAVENHKLFDDGSEEEVCDFSRKEEEDAMEDEVVRAPSASFPALDLSTFGFPSSLNIALLAETVSEHGVKNPEELALILETFPEDVITWMGKKGRFSEIEVKLDRRLRSIPTVRSLPLHHPLP